MSFLVTFILERAPQLRGVLHANFTVHAFITALVTALLISLLGGLYPATRAALLEPLTAPSRE